MFGKLWKNIGSRVWMIVSLILIVLFTVVTILACAVTDFYNLLNMVMPGGGPARSLCGRRRTDISVGL